MILFEPSPKEYLERGRFEQPDRYWFRAFFCAARNTLRSANGACRRRRVYRRVRRAGGYGLLIAP
jgi:hypothetical protein